MKGGPFIDYPDDRTQEVKALLLQTSESRAELLALSQAIDELNQLLAAHPPGAPVESLYGRVPDALKGYVELVSDAHNRPSFRLFEPLLYRSKYYDKRAQSVSLWLTHHHERPFVLSTPRLPALHPGSLHLPLSFDSEALDALGRMRFEPSAAGDMAARLSLNDREQGLFFEMLTGDGRPRHEPVEPGHVRIRYLGHACVLVETANLCILVDPLVGYPVGGRDPKVFSWHDLPERIDYVLLTHNHQDHVMLETLLPLRHRIGQVVVPRCADGTLLDPSLALALRHIGFQRVVELGELASIRDGDCEITGVPFLGEHGDLNILSKLCYHVRVGHRTILFAADSAALEPRVYEHVAAFLGPADVLFLGMECDGAPLSWLYGPLMGPSLTREMDSARRLSGSRCEQALHLLDSFRPKEVYVYAMGQEPWVEFISSIKYTEQSRPIVESNQFLVECQQRSIHAERLYASKQIIRELS